MINYFETIRGLLLLSVIIKSAEINVYALAVIIFQKCLVHTLRVYTGLVHLN